MKFFYYKLLADPNIQQIQAKIKELERINCDLHSDNQILKDKNTDLEDSLSKERSLEQST